MLELGVVLVFAIIGVDSHFFLHFIVIASHKISHLVHDVVFPLSLNSVLIVFQLASEEVGLGILELDRLLLGLFLAGEAWDQVQVLAPTVLDLVGISKPHIVAVVTNELSRHLKDLYLPDLLKVVANLEALHVCVLVELTLFEHLQVVIDPEIFIVYLTSG